MKGFSNHKIEGSTVTEEDIGAKVTYVPRHSTGTHGEGGHIKSWNERFIFVTYATGTKATSPHDLVWG